MKMIKSGNGHSGAAFAQEPASSSPGSRPLDVKYSGIVGITGCTIIVSMKVTMKMHK